jgi:pyruvate,water dikinase
MSPILPGGNPGRRGGDGGETFGVLFRHFRRILTLNNQVLEMVADLERALGGEYIYDRAFLKSSLTGLIEKSRQVIYHLNAMAGDRYARLYDRFTVSADHLADILAGGPGPYGPLLVLDWEVLHRDLVHLAGGKGANLGELANSLKLPTPVGFVVSTTGYRRFMTANDLFARIDQVLGAVADPAARASRIAALFAKAKLPGDLAGAINKSLKQIRSGPGAPRSFAVRSSGVGEDGERSFAGQFQSLLGVEAGRVQAAIVQVMASRFSERLLRYLDPGTTAGEVPMAVVVQPMLAARAAGVLYTRDPGSPEAEVMVVAAVAGPGEELVSGRQSGDRLSLSRHYPFAPRSSQLAPVKVVPAGTGVAGLRRGGGVVGLEILRQLAEYGLLLEKRFESPQDIEWCVDGEERLWLLQSRPLLLRRSGAGKTSAELTAELARLPVLLAERGHVCQLGLARGQVVLVDEDYPAESFPAGAIAVSRYASPRLAGIVRRAAAIITDIGSPTGHLATITREYRTPALFGTGDATVVLTAGTEVVVDVEERTVYRGRVDLPPDLSGDGGFVPLSGQREASLLRRLLRLIAPLNLVDPASPGFRQENCRTIHDFLRFCHERAVAELIDFHLSGRLGGGSGAPFLESSSIPLKIRLIDIGGGLDANPGGPLTADRVTSLPFRALLRGLLHQEAWDREPVPFGVKDFLSGLSRPLNMLTHAPAYSGENLAIIADNYCNLSLRLGYHFNIIDSYLADEPDDNYIYFRFVGGFAESDKRERRAALIGQILSGLHFKVERKGDLVLAKAKMLERGHMESILERLGELIAFTRQLDVKMADSGAVDRFFRDFLERIRKGPGPEGGIPHGD